MRYLVIAGVWTWGFLALVLVPIGFAQPAGPSDLSVDGRRLLQEVVSKYRAFQAYSDQGVIQIEYVTVPNNGKGPTKGDPVKVQLAFARPDKLALTFGNVRVFSDGREMVTVLDGHKRFLSAPSPKEIGLDLFSQDPMGELLSSEYGTYIPFLLALVFGQRPASDLFVLRPELIPGDHVVGGKKCLCIRLHLPDLGEIGPLLGRSKEFMDVLVDPDSRLLVGLDMAHDVPNFFFSALPPAPFEMPPELEIDVADLPDPGPALCPKKTTWRPGEISVRQGPASAFTFQAPQGYRRAMSLEELLRRRAGADADRPIKCGAEPGASTTSNSGLGGSGFRGQGSGDSIHNSTVERINQMLKITSVYAACHVNSDPRHRTGTMR